MLPRSLPHSHMWPLDCVLANELWERRSATSRLGPPKTSPGVSFGVLFLSGSVQMSTCWTICWGQRSHRQDEQDSGAVYLFWIWPSKTQNSNAMNPRRPAVYVFQHSNSIPQCLKKLKPLEEISRYITTYHNIYTQHRGQDKLRFTERSCVCR